MKLSGDRTRTRVLLLGGGFGAIYTGMHLEKLFARVKEVEITLISEQNYLLFTPMLAEVPSSSIEAKHIISPIRSFFKKVQFKNSTVHSIDIEERIVTASHCPACDCTTFQFDYLVLALGSTTNYFKLPGVAENAFPMKTLGEAMALRNHIIDLLEHADMQPDPEIRRAMLTFVVAGGGFAGVETVAELRDFVAAACRYYRNLHAEEIRMVLVHSHSHILPEISATLGEYALRLLKKRGIDVILEAKVASAGADRVVLTDRRIIPTKTLIWTAGVASSPLLKTLPCRLNKRHQVVTDAFLQIEGYTGVYGLGDCAEIPNQETARPYPPTAQHAVRQGKLVAENIAAAIRDAAPKPFRYKPLGVLASLGRRSAVAEVFGFRFSGFLAWWLWRTIYLLKLPGLERKLRVAIDWTLDLFFPPDTVLLRNVMNKTWQEPMALNSDSGHHPVFEEENK